MSANRKERRKSRREGSRGIGASGAGTRSHWIMALIFLTGIVIAGLYYVLRPVGYPVIDSADQSQVEKGRRIYLAECASCHGTNLEGQPNWRQRLPSGKLPAPPHDASGHTWHHTDQALFDITKKGLAAYSRGYQTDMPAFADKLTDEDIAAVLAFIKSSWPIDIRRRQPKAGN
jgi:mono/diheme cytochrome c family protein